MNPLALELNETLKGSVVEALFSDMGKRLYFPNGIISQGGEAAKDAYFANGTIGMAVAGGTPIELDSYKKNMPSLNSRETVAYAKTAGSPDIRALWKEKIIEKNPNLKGKNFSLPVLVPGLTAVLSYVADLLLMLTSLFLLQILAGITTNLSPVPAAVQISISSSASKTESLILQVLKLQ